MIHKKFTFLKFLFIIFFPIVFNSCKSDDVVNNGETTNNFELCTYTTQNVTYDNIIYLSAIDRNSYYAGSFDKFYKVTNNLPAQFTPNAAIFRPYYAYVYDETYTVFSGIRISDNKKQLMIYDNGVYSIIDLPMNDSSAMGSITFYGRGKFYSPIMNNMRYLRYDNGDFTFYTIPGQIIKKIGKSGGNIYMIVHNKSFTRTIYKLEESGYTAIRTEAQNDHMEFLNSDVLSIKGNPAAVSYFTESAWSSLFTLENPFYNFPSVLKGEARNKFIGIRQGGNDSLLAYVWNGTNYIKQTNIPPEVNFHNIFFYSDSEFRDNTFYLLATNKDESKKVIKISLK